jgi:hypothetical protein
MYMERMKLRQCGKLAKSDLERTVASCAEVKSLDVRQCIFPLKEQSPEQISITGQVCKINMLHSQ